jgi:general secretion pathway protein D
MALEHSRLLAASLTVALVGTSCSTPNNAAPTGDNPAGAGEPTAQPNPQGQGQQGQGTSTLDQQRRAALVAKYLEVAQGLRQDGKLDAALLELSKARDLSPENAQVLALINSIRQEQGAPGAGAIDYGDQMLKQRQIAEDRARAEVTEKLQNAQKAMAASNFAGAVDELKQAQLVIQVRDEVAWNDLPAQVKSLLADATQRLDAQTKEKLANEAAQQAQRLREERQAQEAHKRAHVEALLLEAQKEFSKHSFTHARELALEAQEADPSNAIAQDMVHTATKAARDKANEDYLGQKAKVYRQMLESDEELKTPYTDVLSMDLKTWERAQHRAQQREEVEDVDPKDAAVRELLKTEMVGKRTYTEENGGYLDVISNLKSTTKVEIITTPAGREAINTESLKMVIDLVNPIPVENFLNLMVQKSQGLAWTVRNGVVLIGSKAEASGAMISKVHEVKDLVFKRTTFLPPSIRDVPGADAPKDESPRTGSEADEKTAFIDIADLMNNVKEATDPKYWEGEGGGEIRTEESGFLVVKASPAMQRQVEKVLGDIRSFATPVVTIDSKFLTISRNFLQEVGVDFRGLGGTGNKGTPASLDDVTNGLQSNASRGGDNGGTGDPAGNPVSGAFYNDGGDGDVRARTENFFTSPLGNVLTPNGGFTGGWTFINDLQFSMIVRAIEKQDNAEVVNSQLLSVLDRQRGHVAVVNQTAYVRDFDVEVAQASFIADPKVDVIQDGIVLDVLPVIQQDRKYIILNLTPTVAELTRPIPTFTTSLAGSTLPVTLQLPNLTVTSFSTTARVPDGGTVLLGGLREVLTRERRAEIPLLASLPLISFLFKQEGTADENSSLMVMVTARITDVRDLEGK